MGKRKKLTSMIVFIGIILIAIMLILIGRNKNKEEFSEEYIKAEELAPLLSFTYYDTEQWKEIISTLAKGRVNYKELEAVLEYLNVREYVTYKEGNGFQNVSRSEFFQIYDQVKGILDVDNRVAPEERIFIGEKPKEESWLTQQGYEVVSVPMEYIKQYDMYRVYTCDGNIIGIVERIDTPILWENVFVHTMKGEQAELLHEKELLTIQIPELSENITDTICDIEFTNRTVTAIYKKEEMIQGKVLSYNEQQIEIEGYGALAHSGDLKIYKTYGTVEQLDETKLMIGNLIADFVVAKGQVCGIILKEPAQIENIRVLLLNGTTPYYSEVFIKSNEDVTVTFMDAQQILPANTVIKSSDYWALGGSGFLKIQTSTKDGNIFLVNENGEALSLGYQGHFEVRKYEEGYCVVNELSLEDYLCAVVPSEMPSSYEKEALRAQAVCARSYACIQLEKNQYVQFGANVDDSTNYQVYNKQARSEAASLAVKDTVGEVMLYNGAVAEAYYYSTSCGMTQTMHIWNQADDTKYGYLQNVSLLTDGSQPDLSGEETFADFIKNNGYTAYDSDAGYFRWRAELDLNGRKEDINQMIANRRAVNAEHVQIYDGNGNPTEVNLSELGNILQLQVEERTSGGVIKCLRILYEKGSVLLITEYNIRSILGTCVLGITDKNGNAMSVISLLPSAAFSPIPVETGYVLYGGGYGHGIGMSQNGANGMAKAGFTYGDILRHFYRNITIDNIYNRQNSL